ncbi:tetratricopeptide repeat protein [Leptolyngbya sp. 15MV]|nr:tetratricopeptide repeat protein [Leptolyngbya sp. 15MV]
MRIDGWKSIANYLGRDRSTVMRWASARDMPVHRIPGGGRGSVFALTEELDAWLAVSPDVHEEPDQATDAAQSAVVSANRLPGWRAFADGKRSAKLWLIMPLVLMASLAAFAFQDTADEPAAQRMPQDPAAAALFLEARADWAQRRPESIASAIEKLQQVVAREPSFAPAYAALADCYVLANEFGSLPPAEAFGRAQSAVDAALRIDPASAAAWRAKGFLDYWWRRDPDAARQSFERSFAIAPDVAQTHFWYGNILIDNGDFEQGLAELDQARLLEPVSVALQADYAWALWSAGEEQRSLERLEALRARHPELATIRDYLAVAYLAKGDVPAFVRETGDLAKIRGDQEDMAEVEDLARMHSQGDRAVLALFVDQTLADFVSGDRKSLVWPVYVASMADDRDEVLRLLTIAAQRNEIWGSAGLVRQIDRHWRGDRAIQALLEPRRSATMVRRRS